MLDRVVHVEATPPLSFAYEWFATKITGTSEFGLRLPFALLGILIVPAIYVVARASAPADRAALIAAAPRRQRNPMLVWHAQDARAYSLLVLLLTRDASLALQRRPPLVVGGLSAGWRWRRTTSPR